jgi:hypothetical protein
MPGVSPGRLFGGAVRILTRARFVDGAHPPRLSDLAVESAPGAGREEGCCRCHARLPFRRPLRSWTGSSARSPRPGSWRADELGRSPVRQAPLHGGPARSAQGDRAGQRRRGRHLRRCAHLAPGSPHAAPPPGADGQLPAVARVRAGTTPPVRGAGPGQPRRLPGPGGRAGGRGVGAARGPAHTVPMRWWPSTR